MGLDCFLKMESVLNMHTFFLCWGWGEGLVSKVFNAQAWRLEFGSPGHTKISGMVAQTCNLSSGQNQQSTWGSSTRYSCAIGEIQIEEETPSQEMESIGEKLQYPPSNCTVPWTVNDLDIIQEDILRLFWHLQLGEVEPDLKLLLCGYSRFRIRPSLHEHYLCPLSSLPLSSYCFYS